MKCYRCGKEPPDSVRMVSWADSNGEMVSVCCFCVKSICEEVYEEVSGMDHLTAENVRRDWEEWSKR